VQNCTTVRNVLFEQSQKLRGARRRSLLLSRFFAGRAHSRRWQHVALLPRLGATLLVRRQEWQMTTKAREFIDFWTDNSVHAAEQLQTPGGSQDPVELTRRCIEAAKEQGVSEADMQTEIGDVYEYIRARLKTANKVESDRTRPGN
jgi:hypothetical protein